jgi:hypothetical protein
VEHGSTGNRAEPGDAVEHGSAGSQTKSDDAAEQSSTGGRTKDANTAEHAASGSAPDPGGVTVRVGLLEDVDGTTGFYVEDDGPGIPADKCDQLFEPGYSTDPDGTGYGLAIVMWIAEAHEWEVSATEGTAGGARFEFTGVEFV